MNDADRIRTIIMSEAEIEDCVAFYDSTAAPVEVLEKYPQFFALLRRCYEWKRAHGSI